jgi:translation initiation factor 5
LNHPPTTSSTFGGNKTGSKKEAATRKSKKGKNTNDDEEPEVSDKSATAQDSDDEAEEVVWFSDTSAEAARKRREEMLPDSLMVFKDQANRTMSWQDVLQIISDTPADKVVETLLNCKENKFSDEAFVELLFKAIYASVETDAEFKEATKLRKPLLQKFLDSSSSQVSFLQAFERFAGEERKKLLPKAAFILKDLYDTDMIDEENILEWYSKQNDQSVGAIRENVAPLVKWLKEAEEEDSEEEEDDDDDE